MDPLKLYFLLKMVIFHCYASFARGSDSQNPKSFQNGLAIPVAGHGHITEILSSILAIQSKVFPFRHQNNFGSLQNWVVVSNIFYFHPFLEKWSNLTNVFQMGRNHQLVLVVSESVARLPSIDVKPLMLTAPSCKWFWSGFWVPKHLLTGYLEH